MRARGLKPVQGGVCLSGNQSRPMRARGLKPTESFPDRSGFIVAPHAGAWIETLVVNGWSTGNYSRAPCGRVD